MDDCLSYIFSFIPFDKSYFLVNKQWKNAYQKAIQIYPIKIRVNKNSKIIRHIHTLYMSGCTGITDLSPIKGIHTLYMSYCTQIIDLSPIKGIHTLYMNG